jgi:hypothetical protein
MSANHHSNKSVDSLKLPTLLAIFAFSIIVFVTPDATARGGHGGGHHVGSGSHTGHGRHFGGHSNLGGSHRHSGGHRHFGSGHRSFGSNHNRFGSGHRSFGSGHNRFGSGHRSFGSDHNRFGNGHRRFGSGHRRLGGRHRHFGGYSGGYPRYSYAYSPAYYAPRAYSYYNPSYSTYRPRYYSSPSYLGRNNYPKKYAGGGNTYSYNSVSARYPDTATESYSTNDLGWRLLGQNNPREALDVFATQAGKNHNDGVPKVGYALSAAMQGDLNKAAWAMRRAFRIDPDSLHYLKIDALLRTRIDMLLAEYHDQLNYAQGNRHVDVAFMIAALNYLIHENDAARAAIEASVDKLGDNSPSALNLQRLVVNNEY